MPNALTPYVGAAKAIGVGLVLAVVFYGGCSVQKGRESDKRHALELRIKDKDAALSNAATALRASGAALREVNAQAAADVARADRDAMALEDAGKVARAAQQAAEKRATQLAKQLDDARKRPGCDALQNMDLEAVCGIKPR